MPRPDVEKMSVQELTALIQEAEAKRLEKLTDAKVTLLSEFREKAALLGLTLESLVAMQSSPASKTSKTAGTSLPVKYRSPNGEEWSGRGRLPKWLQAAEADGNSREIFRV